MTSHDLTWPRWPHPTWHHMTSHDLRWPHPTWHHMTSHDITWPHPTWPHMTSHDHIVLTWLSCDFPTGGEWAAWSWLLGEVTSPPLWAAKRAGGCKAWEGKESPETSKTPTLPLSVSFTVSHSLPLLLHTLLHRWTIWTQVLAMRKVSSFWQDDNKTQQVSTQMLSVILLCCLISTRPLFTRTMFSWRKADLDV